MKSYRVFIKQNKITDFQIREWMIILYACYMFEYLFITSFVNP